MSSKTTLAPICLFVYNRFEETKLTVEALQLNHLSKESNLYIFSDGPKNETTTVKVNEVRQYINSISGFKSVTIYESQENKGLANSIVIGVTKIINKYGKVIVLEDDLITSSNFLNFMNSALEFYNNSKNIQSISGFSLEIKNNIQQSDVFFNSRAFSWGWATWKNRWDKNIFDITYIKNIINNDKNILKKFKKECGEDISEMLLGSITGKNNSWYVRWAFNQFVSKRLTVYPFLSKVYNIGFSNKGTHCNGINVFKSKFDTICQRSFVFSEQFENEFIKNEFIKYFSKVYKLKFRLILLLNSSGRKSILSEIKFKVLKKLDF